MHVHVQRNGQLSQVRTSSSVWGVLWRMSGIFRSSLSQTVKSLNPGASLTGQNICKVHNCMCMVYKHPSAARLAGLI